MKTENTLTTRLILMIIIIIFINVLASRFFFRLDFTADQRYSLSQATENILNNLNEPVTVTVYFTEDVEPNVARIREELKDLLVEYKNASDGNLYYEFLDPTEDPELQQKAQQAGIRPVSTDASDQNQIKIQRVYAGMVVQKGNKMEVIPQINPGAGLEYTISTSIKKIAASYKPSIGFISGHGEMGLNEIQPIQLNLSELYDLQTVNLDDTATRLSDFKTIVILAPKDSLPPHHIQMIDEYMQNGGNLFYACSRVSQDPQTGQGVAFSTGLEDWLAVKGIDIKKDFLIDFSCGSVPGGEQQMGIIRMRRDVKFPYFPITTNFSDHLITKGLSKMYLPFTSIIEFTGDSSTVNFNPLVMSSANSATETPPLYFNIQKTWTKNDFPLSDLTIGALVTGKLFGENQSKAVVIANGVFPMITQVPSNLVFMINSIDYLSDDTGLIDLRNEAIVSRDLDDGLKEGNIILMKWLNFLLPIIIIIVYGIIRMQHNRNIRVKRMEEGYV